MTTNFQIEEIQGLYGPFTLSERVLQKIWLRQDFDRTDFRTDAGEPLAVVDPGRWNLLGGPDFKDARLVIGGRAVSGDVEVHFRAADWHAHGHGSDPAYDRVVLHVLLRSDDGPSRPVRTSGGVSPVQVSLLPFLDRDLEDYAEDEALLAAERLDELEWLADFLDLDRVERERRIGEGAESRWQRKLDYAKRRLDRSGWEEACHEACLEVLGYARNRAPMSRIAMRHSLQEFCREDLNTDQLFASEGANWKLDGVRPANHPRERLRRYHEMVRMSPDWPERLRERLSRIQNTGGLETATYRRRLKLRPFAAELRESVLQSAMGEARFHTLMNDAMLPLLAAAGVAGAMEAWRHWFPGDRPDGINRFVKRAGLTGPGRPLSNGVLQGALAHFLSEEGLGRGIDPA